MQKVRQHNGICTGICCRSSVGRCNYVLPPD
nr:MAG TPA: hypothetical protein [Siphoviridae sp. ctqOv4]